MGSCGVGNSTERVGAAVCRGHCGIGESTPLLVESRDQSGSWGAGGMERGRRTSVDAPTLTPSPSLCRCVMLLHSGVQPRQGGSAASSPHQRLPLPLTRSSPRSRKKPWLDR
jgi:hypothetical protein